MVSQKLISLKIDTSQMEKLDGVLPLIGLKRNDFINRAIELCLTCVSTQVDIALRSNKDVLDIPFLQ